MTYLTIADEPQTTTVISTRAAGSMGFGALDMAENRSRLFDQLKIRADSVCVCRQVHGSDIVRAGAWNAGAGSLDAGDAPEGDGWITDTPGVVLGILTADCPAVILSDGKHLAAVHASWRSIISGICEKTLGRLEQDLGADPGRLYAQICPSVCRSCYEVQEDVAQQFRARYPRIPDMVTRSDRRIFLGLREVIGAILETGGVQRKRIRQPDDCSSCCEDLFFSYRRDGGDCGRQLVLAWIKR